MTQEYRYVCEDHSVLLPVFRKYLWEKALPLFSERISPNTLSIVANLCSLLALAILLVVQPHQHYLFMIPAVLTFLYLSLDNMDGMHARRTGQCSPLGEFLDHWLDAFNSNFLVLGLYYSARLPPEQILLVLAGTNLAFFATFWEQRHTGRVHFGRGGQIEGVMVITLVYIGIALFGHASLCSTKILGLVSVVEATAIFLGIGYVVTIAGCIWRTRRGMTDWISLVLSSAACLGWYLLGNVEFFPIALILTLTNAIIGGRFVIERVLARPRNSAEPIFVGALGLSLLAAVGFKLQGEIQTGIAWLIVVYLVGRISYEFVTTVNALRHHFRPGELLERAFPRRKHHG